MLTAPKGAVPAVCVITTVHYPLDTRIYVREVQSLSKRYVVDYYAPSDGRIGPARCSGESVPLRSSVAKLGRIRTFLSLVKALLRKDYRLYHLHDPELLPLGLVLKRLGKKVVFDMHENVLEDISTKDYLRPLVRRLVFKVFDRLYRSAQRRFDWFILAESSYRKAIACDRYTVIHNYPLLSDIATPDRKDFPLGLVYVGSITSSRGIWTMLKVFDKIHETFEDSSLHLVGPIDEKGMESKLRQWIDEKMLSQRIHFHGRMPNDLALRIVGQCGIGLCLLEPNLGFEESYPTKMFEYMMVNTPVVVSDFPLWRGIVEECGCGIVVDPRGHAEIADAIVSLLKDHTRLREMGGNGQMAVRAKYNWATEEKHLFAVYDDLMAVGP